jgi:carbohydrate kinase (thermoresistant glucokinase family)
MGVAGVGKTTVGQLLARELHCEFLDADTLHPPENIAKMSRGVPLTDEDRAPWLAAIHARMAQQSQSEELVVACSALKQRYRDTLAEGLALTWVYLKGAEDAIRARLEARPGHFFKSRMLASQFADLEEPSDAIVIDSKLAPAEAVRQILIVLSPVQRGYN